MPEPGENRIILRKEDIDRVVPEFNGKVFYDSSIPGVAAYGWKSDTIRVGEKALKENDDVLRSFLRHEKSHAIFAHLSTEQQQELVEDLVRDMGNGGISRLHNSLSAVGYRSEHLSTPPQKELLEMRTLNRGFLYHKVYSVDDQQVYIPRLLSEFLAVLVEHNKFATYSTDVLNSLNEQEAILLRFCNLTYNSLLSQKSKDALGATGLLNFDAFAELEQLKKDPSFLRAKSK